MSTHSLSKGATKAPYAAALAHLGSLAKDDEIVSWKPATIVLKSGDRVEIPLFLCDTFGDVVRSAVELADNVGDK